MTTTPPLPQVHAKVLRKSNTVGIACPTCHFSRNLPAAQFQGMPHLIKVQCQCGAAFLAKIDFRDTRRKPTRFEGYYRGLDPADIGAHHPADGHEAYILKKNCNVINLSINGIGLEIIGRHRLAVGMHLLVTFRLDSAQQKLIDKAVIIRFTKDQYVGCEFFEPDRHKSAIGFYLLA